MSRTDRERAAERAIIRDHYGLNRPVTEAEREAEFTMLYRKKSTGHWDDRTFNLAVQLRII